MKIFNLPDLGEGLPDAEIHEWFVKEGDTVKLDQPLVAMETAKAVVEVPAPQEGIIEKIYGKPGDVIKTGAPLVSFVMETAPAADKGTVVGHLEENANLGEDNFTIGLSATAKRVTPAIRMLAKKMGINLKHVIGTGEHGMITRQDLEKEAEKQAILPEGYEPLRGVRRAMQSSMVQSHQEVVPVSIFDEADINAWKKSDITTRLIQAIAHACKKEPALNAWFDGTHIARKCFDQVNLGLAIDSQEGLFVPVIHHVEQYTEEQLRVQINDLKSAVESRTIGQDQLKGATITLSNFGKFAGRFASPIIVPPMVAILAVGRLHLKTVSHEGKVEAHRILPLSLSFDHRAVTGGEATRFLGAVIESLERK